jgi:hypothetical protein
MKYYMKTGVTGVGTRDAGTSEFSIGVLLLTYLLSYVALQQLSG